MTDLRKEFEGIPEIVGLIAKGAWWCEWNNYYDADLDAKISIDELEILDEEWKKFQELKK